MGVVSLNDINIVEAQLLYSLSTRAIGDVFELLSPQFVFPMQEFGSSLID
jgi:hypothetical protein